MQWIFRLYSQKSLVESCRVLSGKSSLSSRLLSKNIYIHVGDCWNSFLTKWFKTIFGKFPDEDVRRNNRMFDTMK